MYERRGGADAATPEVSTALPAGAVSAMLKKLSDVPEGFNIHPTLAKLVARRADLAAGVAPLDWGAGEAVAFASLLVERTAIRLSGQDCGRGTFSHRHSVWHDAKTG